MATFEVPSPPFIAVPGVPNFRDVGGYPVASAPGKVVKRGVVFRSSEPSNVTDEGVTMLQELKITSVYDLRSRREMQRDAQEGYRQAKEWDGAERIFAPVVPDEAYSQEAITARINKYGDKSSTTFIQAWQQDILKYACSTNNPDQPYKKILSHLASSSGPTPIQIHCSAGKDRTGVICALILSLCGVEDEIVAHEYSLTDLGNRSRFAEFLKALTKEPSLKADPAGARRMIMSRQMTMIGLLNNIREQWGSVENCAVTLGMLDEDGIKQLRVNLVVDAAGEGVVEWQSHANDVSKAQEEDSKQAEELAAAQA